MKSASRWKFSQGRTPGAARLAARPRVHASSGRRPVARAQWGRSPPARPMPRSRSSSTASFAAAIVPTAAPTRSRRLSRRVWAAAGDRTWRVAHIRPRLAVQPLWNRPHRAAAGPLSIQQPARGLSGLRGNRPHHGARSQPDRSRPVQDDPLRRDRPVVDPGLSPVPRGIAGRRAQSSTFRSTFPSSCLGPTQVEFLIEGDAIQRFCRASRLLSRP